MKGLGSSNWQTLPPEKTSLKMPNLTRVKSDIFFQTSKRKEWKPDLHSKVSDKFISISFKKVNDFMLILFQGCNLFCWLRSSRFVRTMSPFVTMPPLLDNNANKIQVRHLTILQICTRNREVKVIFIRIYRSSHLGYSGEKNCS